jgi:hypothetical protein
MALCSIMFQAATTFITIRARNAGLLFPSITASFQRGLSFPMLREAGFTREALIQFLQE